MFTVAYNPLVSSPVSPETPPAGEASNTNEASTSIFGETSTSDDYIVIDNNDIDGDDGKIITTLTVMMVRLRLSDMEIEKNCDGVELLDVHAYKSNSKGSQTEISRIEWVTVNII